MTLSAFAGLGLDQQLLAALDAEGYTTPTPIQSQAIPLVLDGRDLVGIAQTGTGKTAAFLLPILQRLVARRAAPPLRAGEARSLILAPTRELALQIAESAAAYGRNSGLRHAVIFGGVGHGAQIKAMARGVDILIATPGRLLDHMGEGAVRLDRVEVLILDEADRMFDMGFIRDVRRIVARCPKARQTLLFSATMPVDVAELVREVLTTPLRVEVRPQIVPVDRIEQRVYHVAKASKRNLLSHLLADAAVTRAIVFTRTKHAANRVAQHLERTGVASDALHGNKSQNARQRALAGFKNGTVRVLVATDIAARGIDVDDVSHVINYELPDEAESYVHRIGRTARAGRVGIALSLCDASERGQLRDIERLTRHAITVTACPAGLAEDDGGGIADDRAGHRRGRAGGRDHGGRRDAHKKAEGRHREQRGPGSDRRKDHRQPGRTSAAAAASSSGSAAVPAGRDDGGMSARDLARELNRRSSTTAGRGDSRQLPRARTAGPSPDAEPRRSGADRSRKYSRRRRPGRAAYIAD